MMGRFKAEMAFAIINGTLKLLSVKWMNGALEKKLTVTWPK